MERYLQRRLQLSDKMDVNSVAVVFGATKCIRNGDQEYPFRQDSDFWYLTGINEPNAVLIIEKKQSETQHYLFCKEISEKEKQWFGDSTLTKGEFTSFDDIFELNELEDKVFNKLNHAKTLYHAFSQDAKNDECILRVIEKLRIYGNWSEQWKTPEIIKDFRSIVHELRVVKSLEEQNCLSFAADITARTAKKVIDIIDCGISERKVAAFIEYEFRNNNASGCAFESIIASGSNACIIHHLHSDKQLKEGELILIDIGCEYQNYAGDISRTFPVSGCFTEEQKRIYEIVLNAQKKAINQLQPGVSLYDLQQEIRQYFLYSLAELGLISSKERENDNLNLWYPHDIGHYIGLDLHDVGLSGIQQNRPLEEGMLVTIEPGLYFTSKNCPDTRYCNIGIRIEDTVLITRDGHKILTDGCPKEIEEIEQLMDNKNRG
ncbi:aminopeptidase P N-terminal domain-containing protein [Klebsiella aerogenes]|uniref:aminopeptidase P N-terminal domain-containing protein n=1 Tax=Klebsiella aerogenes TaxID=548 RepID=UPI001867534A|nr:aminopeptidase P N-terminal domain-containing protein [Klebsiella aerogenes]